VGFLCFLEDLFFRGVVEALVSFGGFGPARFLVVGPVRLLAGSGAVVHALTLRAAFQRVWEFGLGLAAPPTDEFTCCRGRCRSRYKFRHCGNRLRIIVGVNDGCQQETGTSSIKCQVLLHKSGLQDLQKHLCGAQNGALTRRVVLDYVNMCIPLTIDFCVLHRWQTFVDTLPP
jgi:hypothetical protein